MSGISENYTNKYSSHLDHPSWLKASQLATPWPGGLQPLLYAEQDQIRQSDGRRPEESLRRIWAGLHTANNWCHWKEMHGNRWASMYLVCFHKCPFPYPSHPQVVILESGVSHPWKWVDPFIQNYCMAAFRDFFHVWHTNSCLAGSPHSVIVGGGRSKQGAPPHILLVLPLFYKLFKQQFPSCGPIGSGHNPICGGSPNWQDRLAMCIKG